MPQSFATRPKLGEEITRHLREQILTGAYPEDDRLAIDKLAQELGVSSMPVREAMTTLASEGIVEMLPRRGFRVATVSPADIEDTFLLHAMVAGELARRACENLTDEVLEELTDVQADIERVAGRRISAERRLSEIESLNFTFHRKLNSLAEDRRRLRWFLRATQRFIPGQHYFTTPGWLELTVNDHQVLLAALQARDCAAAEVAMRAHIRNGGDLIIEQMR